MMSPENLYALEERLIDISEAALQLPNSDLKKAIQNAASDAQKVVNKETLELEAGGIL